MIPVKKDPKIHTMMISVREDPKIQFHRAPKNSKVKNLSLFTYYKRLFKLDTFQDVLLVYVSRREKDSIPLTPQIKGKISKLSDSNLQKYLKIGVLSNSSTFYQDTLMIPVNKDPKIHTMMIPLKKDPKIHTMIIPVKKDPSVIMILVKEDTTFYHPVMSPVNGDLTYHHKGTI